MLGARFCDAFAANLWSSLLFLWIVILISCLASNKNLFRVWNVHRMYMCYAWTHGLWFSLDSWNISFEKCCFGEDYRSWDLAWIFGLGFVLFTLFLAFVSVATCLMLFLLCSFHLLCIATYTITSLFITNHPTSCFIRIASIASFPLFSFF